MPLALEIFYAERWCDGTNGAFQACWAPTSNLEYVNKCVLGADISSGYLGSKWFERYFPLGSCNTTSPFSVLFLPVFLDVRELFLVTAGVWLLLLDHYVVLMNSVYSGASGSAVKEKRPKCILDHLELLHAVGMTTVISGLVFHHQSTTECKGFSFQSWPNQNPHLSAATFPSWMELGHSHLLLSIHSYLHTLAEEEKKKKKSTLFSPYLFHILNRMLLFRFLLRRLTSWLTEFSKVQLDTHGNFSLALIFLLVIHF